MGSKMPIHERSGFDLTVHESYTSSQADYPTSGPWMWEPDQIEWEFQGVLCFMFRDDELGVWMAYASVPEGHPLFGVYHDFAHVSVHEGLTFSGPKLPRGFQHMNEDGTKRWWFGFDCGHAMDLRPLDRVQMLMRQRRDGIVYRTVSYVKRETMRVVAQLIGRQEE